MGAATEHPNILLTPLGLPEQRSLRYILQRKFANGMKEDCIAIILNETLKGLSHLHETDLIGHQNVNARQISVSYDALEGTISVQLTVRQQDCFIPEPSYEITKFPTEGIWDLGIMALELGYGSLPGNNTPENLATLAANLIRILKLQLGIKADDPREEEGKTKGKGQESINLEKGKDKGKQPINQEKTEDPINQEKEKGKGKEPINQKKGEGKVEKPINEEETEGLKIIKMPPRLEKLLDDEFVKGLEEKVLAKKKKEDEKRAKEKKKQNKVLEAIEEICNEGLKFAGDMILRMKGDRKVFSRDFLEVVVKCLDKENPTTAAQIMQLQLFHRTGVKPEIVNKWTKAVESIAATDQN